MPLGMFTLTASAYTSGYYTYDVSGGTATITKVDTWSISGAITIPSNLGGYPVTAIGDRAFDSCGKITSVTIPEGVKNIGYRAFQLCSGITKLTLPKTIKYIDEDAFSMCTELTYLYITDLSAWCEIEFVDSSSNPLYYAKNFYINRALATDITIPDGTTKIGNFVFTGCVNLKSVAIPRSVTSIGEKAFSWCENLTSIKLPGSVTFIGNNAFEECNSLTDVLFSGSKDDRNYMDIGIGNESLTDLIWRCDHHYLDATCTEPKTCNIVE